MIMSIHGRGTDIHVLVSLYMAGGAFFLGRLESSKRFTSIYRPANPLYALFEGTVSPSLVEGHKSANPAVFPATLTRITMYQTL